MAGAGAGRWEHSLVLAAAAAPPHACPPAAGRPARRTAGAATSRGPRCGAGRRWSWGRAWGWQGWRWRCWEQVSGLPPATPSCWPPARAAPPPPSLSPLGAALPGAATGLLSLAHTAVPPAACRRPASTATCRPPPPAACLPVECRRGIHRHRGRAAAAAAQCRPKHLHRRPQRSAPQPPCSRHPHPRRHLPGGVAACAPLPRRSDAAAHASCAFTARALSSSRASLSTTQSRTRRGRRQRWGRPAWRRSTGQTPPATPLSTLPTTSSWPPTASTRSWRVGVRSFRWSSLAAAVGVRVVWACRYPPTASPPTRPAAVPHLLAAVLHMGGPRTQTIVANEFRSQVRGRLRGCGRRGCHRASAAWRLWQRRRQHAGMGGLRHAAHSLDETRLIRAHDEALP